MTVSPEIDFVLAGGASVGLGHIMRCAALASEATRRGWHSRAFIDGDPVASRSWCHASGRSDIERWQSWRPEGAARVTFVDHPGEKGTWLARLKQANTRIVVLDDPRVSEQADLTVCPALHAVPLREPAQIATGRWPNTFHRGNENSISRMLSGPRFAILSSAHRSTDHGPLRTRTQLLLSLGGADPHQVTPRIAPVLESVLRDSEVLHGITTRHVVLGPAFKDPGSAIAEALEDAGWWVHRGLDALPMARLMSETKLAVMGFGTSLTELAWHGTPHLSVTHHPSDEGPARTLEAMGIGVHLGYAGSLDLAVVESRFRQALEDKNWQSASSRIAYEALGKGLGIERILDRIAPWVHSTSGSTPEKPKSKGHHVAPF